LATKKIPAIVLTNDTDATRKQYRKTTGKKHTHKNKCCTAKCETPTRPSSRLFGFTVVFIAYVFVVIFMDVFVRVPATVLFCCDFCLPVLWVVVLLSSQNCDYPCY